MKKFLTVVLFLISVIITTAAEGYDTSWFNDHILPDKNYSTFAEVSKIINQKKGNNFVLRNSVCNYGSTETYDTHIVLEMFCYRKGTDENDVFQYFIKIYGKDKISSIRSKIKSGQTVFNFPTILTLETEDSTGIYFGE